MISGEGNQALNNPKSQNLFNLSLNIRMVYLVRDPRAIMKSRKKEKWCQGYSDCEDSKKLCMGMVSDYKAAVEMRKKFPLNFK